MTRKARKALFVLVLLCLIGVCVWITTSQLLCGYLVVAKPLVNPDAIVLMAGGDADRLPAVVELYKKGVAPTVLLTNDGILGAWSSEYSRNLYMIEWTQLELIKSGVPKESIVRLNFTQSGTYYDAVNTREFVRKNGIGSIVVLTSDFHTRRTLWSFEKVFAGYPIELGIYSSEDSCLATGMIGRVKRSATLVYELLKFHYYKFRFGLLESVFH